jgi:hypothetical protein
VENKDGLGITSEEFWQLFEELKEKKEKKSSINTGPTLPDQIRAFGEFSFDEEDERAFHEDALSVCALTAVN